MIIRRVVAQGSRLILCAIALYFASVITLSFMGYSWVTVSSDSMMPTVRRGDIVLLKQQVVAPGDMVMFEKHGTNVLHRLRIRNADGTWTTRGDANATNDPWNLSASHIHGVAVVVLRGFGLPLVWLNDARAQFVSSRASAASASSNYWQQAISSWVIFKNSNLIMSSNPNYVTMTGSGDRKVWLNHAFGSTVRMHFYGRLSTADATEPMLTFLVSACPQTNDLTNCGVAVQFNQRTANVTVRGFTSGNVGGAFASAPYAESLSVNHHLAVSRNGNALVVMADGKVLISISDLPTVAKNFSGSFSSGQYCGFWLAKTNQMSAARLNCW